MAAFSFSEHINPDKIFLVNRSELEGRFEAEYYLPDLRIFEKSIRAKSRKTLNGFILKISSGATPSVTEEEKFYGTQEDRIPFLRVQNLQTNGRLNIADVKYINHETHEGYLKRSQVSGNDLLVKITGVGRMAIASVAPEGFVGNTNQHMVVIKTKNKKISEYLANYLNLDIIEKLASRRSTGATRPALDYPALKSIPVIENIDFSVIEAAEEFKQHKESEAKALLESINDYLLGQLGISLPEPENSLQRRIFTTNFSEISGHRFDSYYHQIFYKEAFSVLNQSNYPVLRLKDISEKITSGITPLSGGEAYTNSLEGIPFIRSGNIEISGSIKFDDLIYLKPEIHKTTMKSSQVKHGDLMIAIVGATIGQVGIYLDHREANINQAIALVRIQGNHNCQYIKEVIKSSIGQLNLNRLKRPVARANINLEEISMMQIIVPPLEKQNEIAHHIQEIRAQAKALQGEAAQVLEEAKRMVEEMILGE